MKLDLINENFPIWEVTSWDFPDINFDNLYLNKFDQSSKTYESSELRQYVHEFPFFNKLKIRFLEQGKIIEEMLRKSDLPLLDRMWKGRLKTLNWPNDDLVTLVDKPGFEMANHTDNRFVLGVLIINLIDNPQGSSTNFPMLKYSSPTEKGTGVFFLNHDNTLHSIKQPGPENRIISYQILTIDSLKENV